jgi:biopolymer transport protein ExbD
MLDRAKHENVTVIIKADRSTSYDAVAQVTNAALEHGISSVALATTAPR